MVLAIQRSVEGLVALLAALKAAAAYVMVDPSDPPAHVGFILSDTGARLVVTLAPFVEALKDHGVPIVEFDLAADGGSTEAHSSAALAGSSVPTDALAYVMYTSGSTGRPKGVMIEHRHVLRRVEGAAAVMPRRGEGAASGGDQIHLGASTFAENLHLVLGVDRVGIGGVERLLLKEKNLAAF